MYLLSKQAEQAAWQTFTVTFTINTGADKHKHHPPKNNPPFVLRKLCLFLSGSLLYPSPFWFHPGEVCGLLHLGSLLNWD